MNNLSPSQSSQYSDPPSPSTDEFSARRNPDDYPALPRGSQSEQSSERGSNAELEYRERAQIRILLGTYSDILFVLLPFCVVLIIKVWHLDLKSALVAPEISLAACVISGLAVVKMVLSLVSHDTMLKYRERLVFMVSATTFLLLTPSLLLTATGYLLTEVPTFILYTQPVLLVAAIATYSGTINAAHSMLKGDRK